MTVGEIIKEYREQHNLSQRKFAAMANITNSYVSVLEMNANPVTGKKIAPTVEVLESVAKAMQMTLDELIYKMGQESQISLTKNDTSAEPDADTLELLFLYSKLTAEGKEALKRIAKVFIEMGTC